MLMRRSPGKDEVDPSSCPRRCGGQRGSLDFWPILTHQQAWSIRIGPEAKELVFFLSIARILAKFGLVSTAGKELQHGLGHHCNINEALDPFAQSEVDRDNYLPPNVG